MRNKLPSLFLCDLSLVPLKLNVSMCLVSWKSALTVTLCPHGNRGCVCVCVCVCVPVHRPCGSPCQTWGCWWPWRGAGRSLLSSRSCLLAAYRRSPRRRTGRCACGSKTIMLITCCALSQVKTSNLHCALFLTQQNSFIKHDKLVFACFEFCL